jgi:signal transduction histidine kinase
MRKEFDFIVSLQRPDFKKYDTISFLLLIAAIFIFLFFFFVDNYFWLYIVSILVIIGQMIYNFYDRKKGQYLDHRISFLVACVTFFFIPSNNFIVIVIALLYAVLALLERQIKFPEEVGINKSGITINTFFKKHYDWSFIDNIILKDGLLTIDYKNNKIFQKEMEEAITPVLEKEFNEFCRLQLRAHGSNLAMN